MKLRAALMLTIAFLCGCRPSTVYGSWRTPDYEMELAEIPVTFTVYSFHPDGKLEKTTYGKHLALANDRFVIMSHSATFELHGDVLTVDGEDWTIRVDGDVMTRTRDGEDLQPLRRLSE